jgi:hypothetical protein
VKGAARHPGTPKGDAGLTEGNAAHHAATRLLALLFKTEGQRKLIIVMQRLTHVALIVTMPIYLKISSRFAHD